MELFGADVTAYNYAVKRFIDDSEALERREEEKRKQYEWIKNKLIGHLYDYIESRVKKINNVDDSEFQFRQWVTYCSERQTYTRK